MNVNGPNRSRITIGVLALTTALLLLATTAWLRASATNAEKRYLTGLAEQFVRALYAGDLSGVAPSVDAGLQDTIISGKDGSAAAARGKTIENISVSAYVVTGADTRRVIVQVYEIPFSTVLFKEVGFRRINGKWLIVSLAHNA